MPRNMIRCEFCNEESDELYTCEVCGRLHCERHMAEEDHHCDPDEGYGEDEDEDETEGDEEVFTEEDIEF